MQHGLDHASLGLKPIREFANEIVVAGVVREPWAGVNDALLNEADDALEISRQRIAAGFDC